MYKPPYRVLSLKEIKEIKKSHKVISTFSGCGGSSLGYRMAGLKVIWANEFIRLIRGTKPKVFVSLYRDWETDRKSTRLNSSHEFVTRMPSTA